MIAVKSMSLRQEDWAAFLDDALDSIVETIEHAYRSSTAGADDFSLLSQYDAW